MPPSTVAVLPYDGTRQTPFGSALIEHRTAQAGFEELGVYYLTFPSGGHLEPWRLHYEETAYVVEGEASITVLGEDGSKEVRGLVGDLIAIPRGARVRYGGTPGTRLLLSMSPITWRDRLLNEEI
jgi:ethanolamine utilization protein EutQ (cupin superfamily)